MIGVSYQPVPSRHHISAMRFLAGGSMRDSMSDAQAQSLYERTLGADPDSAALWWARRWRKTLAVVMIYRNVGRTGMIFASPVTDGKEVPSLVELIRMVTSQEIEGGLSMVQSLLPMEARAESDALRQAGYNPLAELIYMQLRIPSTGDRPTPRPDITWRDYDEFTPAQLEDVILNTYQQSLDCPVLEGVRQIGDVVAGHRATGLFNPHTWWIASVAGKPAGCILLNDCLAPEQAEVIYLGVVPEFRSRGVAKAILAHAIDESRSRSIKTLSLAVDAANLPAKALYVKTGFIATHRRQAMIWTWKDSARVKHAGNPC